MLQRSSTDVSTVFIALGGGAFLVDFTLTGLAHNETRWLKVRGLLKFSLALIVIGAVVASAGVLAPRFFPQSLFTEPLVLIGVASFILGIIIEVASFTIARNKPAGNT